MLFNRIKEPQRADRVHIARVLGHLETYHDMALRAEVIDLIGLNFFDEAAHIARVGQVAVVQEEPFPRFMRILVDVVDSSGIKARRPTDNTVYLVILCQKKFGEVGAVLAGDASN